jgi:hypothetical protein
VDHERYSIDMAAIGQQQIDLLECLVRIDRGEALDGRASALRDRMIEAGLVDVVDGALRLTTAGIERCRSLQHRLASDREAARVLAERGIAISLEQHADS